MPPHNLFDSDCQSSVSVGQFFNSLLSTSLNTLTPMCNDSAVSPMCNDSGAVSSPMCDDSSMSPPMCNNGSSPPTMCNESPGPRVYSPTYPMNHQPTSAATSGKSHPPTSSGPRSLFATASAATPPGNPRRPPLNPIKPKPSYRNRKKVGLSINVPRHGTDPHNLPAFDEGEYPRISCSTNVELRRKSLSERHFFRPVSEDEESVLENKQ
mmetsp:Transcript_44472/g.94651  ORF Transcript_44472/g.94651 Transcript_44472/m.94651 type:complete len:210 (+) Transcript_44472:283-912(+)